MPKYNFRLIQVLHVTSSPKVPTSELQETNSVKNLEQSFTRLIMHNKTVVWPPGQICLLTERKGRKYGVLYHIVKQDLTPLLC